MVDVLPQVLQRRREACWPAKRLEMKEASR